MKTQSAKAKGRNLQKWVRDLLLSLADYLTEDDILSTSMGASGEDIKLSPLARKTYPIAIECKNQEKVNIWSAYEQATTNAKTYQPVLIIKKNRKEPLAIVDAQWFFKLFVKHD